MNIFQKYQFINKNVRNNFDFFLILDFIENPESLTETEANIVPTMKTRTNEFMLFFFQFYLWFKLLLHTQTEWNSKNTNSCLVIVVEIMGVLGRLMPLYHSSNEFIVEKMPIVRKPEKLTDCLFSPRHNGHQLLTAHLQTIPDAHYYELQLSGFMSTKPLCSWFVCESSARRFFHSYYPNDHNITHWNHIHIAENPA